MQNNVNKGTTVPELESLFSKAISVEKEKIKRTQSVDNVVTLKCHVKDIKSENIQLLSNFAKEPLVADLFIKRSGAGQTVFAVINPY